MSIVSKLTALIAGVAATTPQPKSLPQSSGNDNEAQRSEASHASEPSGLTADAREERDEALSRRTAQLAAHRDRNVAELQRLIAEEHAACVRGIEEAQALARATYERLALRFVADFHEAIGSLARAWIEGEPSRALAMQIAETFLAFDARARRELREATGAASSAISVDLLLAAFADPLVHANPSATNAFGVDGWGSARLGEHASRFVRAVSVGGPELAETIEDIERELRNAARSCIGAPDERLARRYAVKGSCATYPDANAALRAFDEAEERARSEAWRATYVPPPREPSLPQPSLPQPVPPRSMSARDENAEPADPFFASIG